jgi:hypothetical protein
MNTRNFLAFGLIALLGAACGSSKSSAAAATTKAWSCNVPTVGNCTVVTGIPAATDMTQFNSQCTGGSGTVGTSCPTANRVGTCTYPGATAADPVQVDSYYTSNWDATTAEPDCVTATQAGPGGTWKAG